VKPAAFASAVVARWRGRGHFRLRSLDFVSHRAVRRFDLSRRLAVNVAFHDQRTVLHTFVSTTTIAAARSHDGTTQHSRADRQVVKATSALPTIGAMRPRRTGDGIRAITSLPSIAGSIVGRDAARSTTTSGARIFTAPVSSTRRIESSSVGATRTRVSPAAARRSPSPLQVRRLERADRPIATRHAPARLQGSIASAQPATAMTPRPARDHGRMPTLAAPRRLVATGQRAPRRTASTTTPMRQVSHHVDRSMSIVHRTSRIERTAAPVAFDRPRLDSPGRPAATDGRARAQVHAAARRRAAGAAAGFDLAEVERAIAARVEQRIDQKISAGIKASLQSEADLSRTMTDRVYDALYDRMILEKERRG
jgi:hypothetical protein